MTREVYYTKAGDFEQLDQFGTVVLMRDQRRFDLAIEPGVGVPSGRAARVKILPNGQVQGVDFAGKIVTDFKLATIPLFVFDNPARLASDDGVFFVPTPYSGAPQRVELPMHAQIGVHQHKLALSNGEPDALFARLVALCKSKKRLVEIVTQPRINIGRIRQISDEPAAPLLTDDFNPPAIQTPAEPDADANSDVYLEPEVETIPAPEKN